MSSRKTSIRRMALAVAAVLAYGGIARAEKVSIDLGLTPPGAVNSVEMTLTTNLNLGGTRSSTRTINTTGNILADLDMLFDSRTKGVSIIDTFDLTGGHVSARDTTFVLDYSLAGKITIKGQGMGG